MTVTILTFPTLELLFKYFINFTALLLSPFPGEDSRL